MSCVFGERKWEVLKRRHATMIENTLFKGMEYSGRFRVLKSGSLWLMEGRPEGVNSRYQNGYPGAGGHSLLLLEKSGIPEAKGYGGFPVGGQWLRCTNEEVIAKHHAKVYDTEKGKSVFSDAKVCFGGSGMCSGRAYKTEGGYLVSGVWKYATGSPHLTHFTANVPVFDGDAACADEKGQASFITIFADHTDVELIRDWNTFGLESTASHSFKLDNVFIADNQVYSLLPEKATLADPIYSIRYAIWQR
ncbi:hypothetical protein FQR65_LT17566 [Abscondita terminalis]|nr:hypothetical protein FQR65_LT17566 [Abscondita terminalis]